MEKKTYLNFREPSEIFETRMSPMKNKTTQPLSPVSAAICGGPYSDNFQIPVAVRNVSLAMSVQPCRRAPGYISTNDNPVLIHD